LNYEPHPIDTSGVALAPEILQLTERLAAHAHDVWGAKRLAEGWRYGPKKDGAKKETPLLVPYGELPDSEKQYDRALAQETLKALMALGYSLVPSPPGHEGSDQEGKRRSGPLVET
jgi:hypothetical protein